MKKVVFLAALTLGLSTTTMATESPKSLVFSQVKEAVIYPTIAKERKIEGTVYASYTVNQNGSITIHQIESREPYLKNYVKEQLEDLVIQSGTDSVTDKLQVSRFVFKLA